MYINYRKKFITSQVKLALLILGIVFVINASFRWI